VYVIVYKLNLVLRDERRITLFTLVTFIQMIDLHSGDPVVIDVHK